MKESVKITGRVSIIWSLGLFGDEDLSGEFERGAHAFPLIQEVQAGGVTTEELEDAITDKLKPAHLKNPRVGVQVVNYRASFIPGKVKLPGSYPYVSGMTVFSAVDLAGGYTYREKTALLAGLIRKQRSRLSIAIHTCPGDVIIVPERFL